MNYQVVVPLEGSAVDDEVIPFVRKFAQRPDTRITLLHVMPDLSPFVREHIDAQCGQERQRLRAFRDRLGVDAPEPGCELRMGDPVREILKFAALLPADLLIMPAHGRRGLDRLIHGSVTEDVLRLARCPLLLPPAGAGRPQDRDIDHLFDRILVPIDGSDSSFSIIPLVVELARSYSSEVILFHDYADTSDGGDFLDSSAVDKRIQDYRALLGYAGISVSTEVTGADRTVDDILDAVSSTNAGLVAMAAHDRRGLERLGTASVVGHVLRHVARPLLVYNTSSGQTPDSGERLFGQL